MRTCADLEEAIVEGAARRIRPKLMTVVTMMRGPACRCSGAAAPAPT